MKKKIRNFKIKRFRCKALVGDPSDNIPGIFGIGEKTAIEILLKFGSLGKLYEKIEEKKIDQKIKETLLKYKGQALFSKDLAKIRNDVPGDFNLTKHSWKDYNKEKVKQILKKFEFYSLIKRLPELEELQGIGQKTFDKKQLNLI